MISEMEKSIIRQHLGYPMLTLSGGFLGQGDIERTALLNTTLESKLNAVTPIDEAIITGAAVGTLAVMTNPVASDQVTISITGSWIVGSVSATATVLAGDSDQNFCGRLVGALARDAAFASNGMYAYGPFPGGSGGFPASTPQIAIKGPQAFTISATMTGNTAVAVTNQGALAISPQATVGSSLGVPIVLNGYLPILNWLYGARAGATRNADTAKAGEWVRGNEREQRNRLYQDWRVEFANKLGVPLYDGMAGPSCSFIM